MHSKTSLFNKTLFKKDIKLVAWLAFVVTILLFLDVPMSHIRYLNAIERLNPQRYDYQEIRYGYQYIITGVLGRNTPTQVLILLIMPIITAVLLIGEERRTKTFDLLSVMPYTRGQIYFNKILAGISTLCIPYGINFLATAGMRAFIEPASSIYTRMDLYEWLWLSIVPMLLFYSFTVFMGMIVGTTLAQMILTGIFMIFPMGFWGLVYMNLDVLGLNENHSFVMSRVNEVLRYLTLPLYLQPESFYYGKAQDGTFQLSIILMVVSFALLVISKLLFMKNKMERNGEILLFQNFETFFKIGVAFCTMLLMGGLISMMFDESILGLILGYGMGIGIGWFVPNYFIQISRVKA
jgi:ABC-type transport system involved in multi-copper enzyme maturation permease subunit